MSSTNRGAERDADDKYSTPPEVSRLICRTLKADGWVESPTRLLEPGCGEGSFLDAMATVWPRATSVGVDLNDELVDIAVDRGHEAYTCNFLTVKDLGEPFDAIIGNPPFVHAEAFIKRSLSLCRPEGIVAFILRLNFLGSQERFRTLWNHPDWKSKLARVYVLPARVGFTADGRSDSIEFAVFIFKPNHRGPVTFGFMDNLGTENRWRGEAWLWRRAKGASE